VAQRRAQERQQAPGTAHTLGALLLDYCDYLQALGRRSHTDARNLFRRNVVQGWPEVAALPARDVTAEQFADMSRRLIEAGKGRTANKLRSYARAAYQVAKSARSRPSVPARFKDYGITVNAVADTEPDESQNRADRNPLTADELRVYWRLVRDMPGPRGALLRLHLLTGGQRIEQLVKLRSAEVGEDRIVLYDSKGRPGRPPRSHTVPLVKDAACALDEFSLVGEFALSTDGGQTHIAATSLSKWAVAAASDNIEGFLAKRVRSGVETLLASAGVSREVRGRLQSHGVSGVQARHYDGHDYLDEKRRALDTLRTLLG
jgi:integrase